MNKMSLDQIEQMEALTLIDCLTDGSYTLTDKMISSICGKDVHALLTQLPEHERKWALHSVIEDDYSFKSYTNTTTILENEIMLGEIEAHIPFEGSPEENFDQEALNALILEKDVAYLYCGYLSIRPNMRKLKEHVKEYHNG